MKRILLFICLFVLFPLFAESTGSDGEFLVECRAVLEGEKDLNNYEKSIVCAMLTPIAIANRPLWNAWWGHLSPRAKERCHTIFGRNDRNS